MLPFLFRKTTMSINSWKQEFYHGRVLDAARNVVAATEHSIIKWTGLSEANLKKHDLIKDPDYFNRDSIVNPKTSGRFVAGADQCALCQYDLTHSPHSCCACPLTEVGALCRNEDSPYQRWVRTGNNKPMLVALNRALEYVKKQAGIEA